MEKLTAPMSSNLVVMSSSFLGHSKKSEKDERKFCCILLHQTKGKGFS